MGDTRLRTGEPAGHLPPGSALAPAWTSGTWRFPGALRQSAGPIPPFTSAATISGGCDTHVDAHRPAAEAAGHTQYWPVQRSGHGPVKAAPPGGLRPALTGPWLPPPSPTHPCSLRVLCYRVRTRRPRQINPRCWIIPTGPGCDPLRLPCGPSVPTPSELVISDNGDPTITMCRMAGRDHDRLPSHRD